MGRFNIAFLGIAVLLFLSLFFFNQFTGNVVSEDFNYSVNSSEMVNLTEEQAIREINNSVLIIELMNSEGFSVIFVNDTLTEAKQVFEQAKYAAILRSSDSSETQKSQARAALRLINWQKIKYSDVLVYTSLINQRKDEAYNIRDSLTALDARIQEYSEKGVNVSSAQVLFNQANVSFYEDRYEESLNFIDKIKAELEVLNEQNAVLNIVANNSLNFFKKYWPVIIAVLFVITFALIFGYNKLKIFYTKKRISKTKVQLGVIEELMKKTQEDRFKYNKISGLVYNIRIKSYQEKTNNLKELLPVLESKLENLRKK